MNYTIDDTNPELIWSTGDVWRAQAPNQVSINSNYLLNTYHAAQTKNANVSLTFSGSACQIYGSTGPNHGNYSVTFDDAIKYSPGFSEQTEYRQLLFSHVFGTTFDTHTVVLRNEEDFWLDIDYMVLTVQSPVSVSTSDIGFFATTVSAATVVPDASSTDSSDSSSNSSSNTAIFRTITFVLAGLLALLLMAFLVWFFVLRKRTSRASANNGNVSGNADQGFRYGHKVGDSGTIDVLSQSGELKDGNSGRHSSILGYGRSKLGRGMEDASLMQTPTSASGTSMREHDHLPYNRNSTLANTAVGGAARETLIALNNMGKRPGYRNLGSEGEIHSNSRTSVMVGRDTTPTGSVRTLGSAGQAWLKNDPEARFKGKVGPSSMSQLSSADSDTNLSNISAGAHLLSNRGQQHNRIGSGQGHSRERDEDYAAGGIGLGIYSTMGKADLEQRRMDLRRSASVASSGIIDRLASSPPPAVPELPPMSTTSSFTARGIPAGQFSPAQTDSVYSQSQDPYGTRGKSPNPGALRLQPPPIRGVQEERERERGLRERERMEKEREVAREREEAERERREALRYSRPPPEYVPTPNADQLPPMPTSAQSQTTVSHNGVALQRQGTRTGDIPIAIEGGFGYETESQESHSVAHAYVRTALHISVPPEQQQEILQSQPLPPIPTQTNYSSLPYSTDPNRPHHMRDPGSGSASGSLAGRAASPAAKRALTPDHGRSYTPDRSMAVPGAGRPSEDKVWTLDGPNARGVGMPIMDDRTRMAAVPPSQGLTRKVSRVPPPQP